MKILNCVCLTLTIIGAVNWGIVGFFDYNLVDAIFGTGSALSRIIYGAVGLSGIYLITTYGLVCRDEV